MLAQPHAAATPLAMTQSPIQGSSSIKRLRARARLYRRLAESLRDPQIIAVVLACASECEASAGALAGDEPKGLNGDRRS